MTWTICSRWNPWEQSTSNLNAAWIVMTALADLDRPERQAVTHVILKGQSLRQAGRCIGVSAMTVQRRLKRGLNSLRHTLSNSTLARLITLDLLLQRGDRC